jgi:hypothetical protein
MPKVQEKPKTAALRLADEIAAETLRMLCRENQFPKRSRWLIAAPLADIVNDFHRAVNTANEIKVKSQVEALERHKWQTMALAHLGALDAKMGLAAAVLYLDVDRLEHWAGLVNEERRVLQGWLRADEKRYSSLFGLVFEGSSY